MRSLDELLDFVDSDLKMELVQSELDRYTEEQKNKETQKKEIQDKISDIENKSINHVQRIIDDYHKDKKHKLLFFYDTVNDGKIYLNVIQDDTKTEEEIKQIIEQEDGKITKKFEIKEKILYVDDIAIRKIKSLGKTYKLVEIKK